MNEQIRVRSRFLDGLRGFAALYVALHHIYCAVWRPYEVLGGKVNFPTGLDYYVISPLLYGGVAVGLFIAVSGFSLGAAGLRGSDFSTPKFYLRRLWRITPPYYVGLLLSMILIWTLIGTPTGSYWDLFIDYEASDVLYHILYVQNLISAFAAQSINGAYWSIAVEMQFYILFPLAIFAYRRSFLLGLTASLGLAALALAANRLLSSAISIHLFLLFLLGISGAAVAYSNDRWARLIKRTVPFGWIGIVGLVIGIVGLVLRPGNAFAAERTVIFSLVCWMIEDQRQNKLSAVLKIFDNRILGTVGLFSYSLYLIHEPIEQVIWKFGIRVLTDDKITQFLMLVPVSMLVLLPLSYLFFRAFEEPFLKRAGFEKAYARLMSPRMFALRR